LHAFGTNPLGLIWRNKTVADLRFDDSLKSAAFGGKEE
jgi:hypothetical protein